MEVKKNNKTRRLISLKVNKKLYQEIIEKKQELGLTTTTSVVYLALAKGLKQLS